MLLVSYPIVRQKNIRDCGIAALTMIASYHGRSVSERRLRQLTRIDKVGTSFSSLTKAGAYYGLEGAGVLLKEFDDLDKIAADRPAVLLLDNNHFVVYYGKKSNRYIIGDPARGIRKLSRGQLEAKLMNQPQGPGIPPGGYALLF